MQKPAHTKKDKEQNSKNEAKKKIWFVIELENVNVLRVGTQTKMLYYENEIRFKH